MPFQSAILQGSSRLDTALAGGPSVKVAPPADDPDAVRRIQKALAALGYSLPISFSKGVGGEPDGKFGLETYNAVVAFQQRAFPGQPKEWDGRVGHKTLEQMDALLPRGAGPSLTPTPTPEPTTPGFVCGPDVTDQVAFTWRKVQGDFRGLPRLSKIGACNRILIPVQNPENIVADLIASRGDLNQLIAKLQGHADIMGWDTLPLFRAKSKWLHRPPVYDVATKGPCATPSAEVPHDEDKENCSNSVQVAGKCWLNGTVNYGIFGIMVKECSSFAAGDWGLPSFSTDWRDQPLATNLIVRSIYSLTWATTLIRAYKKLGREKEDPTEPIAWTEATFNGGPTATPSIPGNRPKCKCSCGCKGNVATWDYVWEPFKPRAGAHDP
jgi:peptidoglycan hydrolase-like protein with peptidoglycan-binding domain